MFANADPEAVAGETIAGESFLPLLRGQSWQRANPLYFQYMDNRVIRTDKWTMAEIDGTQWELFDYHLDPLETINLATVYPEVVSDLEQKWLKWWFEESGNPTYSSTRSGMPNRTVSRYNKLRDELLPFAALALLE